MIFMTRCIATLCVFLVSSAGSLAQAEPCLLGNWGHATKAILDTADSARVVHIEGDLAYVGISNDVGLLIIDITDDANPVELSRISITAGIDNIEEIQIREGLAYILTRDSRFVIVDISDPFSPSVLSQVFPGVGSARGLALHGDIAWLIGQSRLVAYEITNPLLPNQLDMHTFVDSDIQRILVIGDTICLLKQSDLVLIDALTPSEIEILGCLAFESDLIASTVEKGTSLVADPDIERLVYIGIDIDDPSLGTFYNGGSGKVISVDISDPQIPVRLTDEIDLRHRVADIEMIDRSLYAAFGNWIACIDVDEEHAFHLKGYLNTRNGFAARVDLEAHGSTLVCAGWESLEFYDTEMTELDLPYFGFTRTRRTPGYPHAFGGAANTVFVVNDEKLLAYDASDPLSLVQLNALNLTQGSSDLYWASMHVEDGYAYVLYDLHRGGIKAPTQLDVFDVSDPASLDLVATLQLAITHEYNSIGGRFLLDDQRLFIGLGTDGVVSVDVSDPANPTLISQSAIAGAAWSVAGVSGLLYIASDDSLSLLSVIDPANPVLVGEIDLGSAQVQHLQTNEDLLCVISDQQLLSIFDISNPRAPELLSQVDLGESGVQRIEFQGDIAYIPVKYSTKVFDLSEPTAPSLLGEIRIEQHQSHQIGVVGERLFLSHFFGFSAIDISIKDCAACAPDITGDGVLDVFDVFAFLDLFAASDLAADFTSDGILDIFDVFAYLDEFAAGCP